MTGHQPLQPRALVMSRRGLLGGMGALALGVALSPRISLAQATGQAPADTPNPLEAILELRPDGTVFLQMPYVEGGQATSTAMAQLVGEELDLDPAMFTVECAPPLPAYVVPGTRRTTGGSSSVRRSYMPMRKLGATARAMLIQAAAARLAVPGAELATEPGRVIHPSSGRSLGYGELARAAAELPVPATPELRSPEQFRWIGKPVARIDGRDKSTGRTRYSIDVSMEGMLLASVKHAPRLGMQVRRLLNEDAVRAMRGVHSVHALAGCVAVVADRWWRANRAVEALQVEWSEAAEPGRFVMRADFSTAKAREEMRTADGPRYNAEDIGDAEGVLAAADKVVEAVYDVPFVSHAQIEPPSATASWNDAEGTLEIWLPNQAPDRFIKMISDASGIDPSKITLHSPTLGGFFGRHFVYPHSSPFPQAVALTRAVGRPVKLIWSREQEFLRDAPRPLGMARMRASIGADGMPTALKIEAVCDSLVASMGAAREAADPTAVEGLAERVYQFKNRKVDHIAYRYPVVVGALRSVGHSLNDFFMESFVDEMADAGGIDPLEWRRRMVSDSARHLALLDHVVEMSGGWRRGPYTAGDGTKRARGIAMASPFGSETATIAEVSIRDGEVQVHDIWTVIDPGRIVNPTSVRMQMQGGTALGLSLLLSEGLEFEHGKAVARNYDGYPMMAPYRMPRVHVGIIESGAEMGGVGEIGVPGGMSAAANAVARLSGERPRSLPLSKTRFAAGA